MRKRGVIVALLAILTIVGCDPLPNRDPAGPVEIQRPDFLGVNSPATGELEVPLNEGVVFAFSEAIDPSTAMGALTISYKGQNAVGTFANSGQSVIDSTATDTVDGQPVYTYTYEHYLTFTPTTNYESSARYWVEITGSVKDVHGNSLSIEPGYSDSSWFFTTGDYANGGWYTTYVLDGLAGEIQTFDKPDTAASQVTGLETPSDIVVSDDGQYVVVSNKIAAGYVSVFDRTLGTQTNVTVGVGPEYLATKGSYAFVVNTSSNTISTIDLATGTEASVLSFTDGFDPGLIAVNPDDDALVVASASSTTPEILKVLSIGNNGALSETSTIDFSADTTMGRAASGLAVYNDEAFVQEDLSSNVHVISLLNDAYEETFSVFLQEVADGDTTVSGDRSRGLIANGGTGYMWSLEGYLYQVDLASRTLVQHITLSTRPKDISFTPTGDLVYISLASTTDQRVEVYEPTYLTKLADAQTTAGTRAIAVGRVK